jgi:putative flippase GtrA
MQYTDRIMYGIFTKNVRSFSRYTMSGVMSFSFDLFLLWLFIDLLHIHYLSATIVAYVIAVSLHFFVSRTIAFSNTTTSLARSYPFFLAVSGIGLISVTVLMYVCMTYLPLHYYTARILVAIIVGTVSFFLHKHLSFGLH